MLNQTESEVPNERRDTSLTYFGILLQILEKVCGMYSLTHLAEQNIPSVFPSLHRRLQTSEEHRKPSSDELWPG